MSNTTTKHEGTPVVLRRRGRRLVALARGVGALIVLVAVVVGVPLLMIRLQMVPHGAPTASGIWHDLTTRDDGRLVAVVLAAGVWLCWALFTLSLLGELAGLARHRPAWRLPGLGVFQRPAAALVAAIAIGLMITPSLAGFATAAATPPPLPTVTATPVVAAASIPVPTSGLNGVAVSRLPDSTAGHAAPKTTGAPPRYRVQRHDTLWGIAERYLHDPLRYPQIVRLNPAVIGPDNEIRPGQILTLPADASGPGLLHPGTPTAGDTRAPATGPAPVVQVRVEPGDTLSGIVEKVTGDGDDWPQAFAANRGRAEPGGQHLTDPNVIWPGWTVTISIPTSAAPAPHPPATASPAHQASAGPAAHHHGVTTPPAASPADPATDQTGHPARHIGPVATGSASPATSADPSPRSANPPTAAAAAAGPTGTPAAAAAATATPPTSNAPAALPRPAAAQRQASAAPVASHIPVAAFAGGGLLLAGGSATTLMWLRRRQQRHRRPGRIIASAPPGLEDMERAVRAAGSTGAPKVAWLDQALRSLAQATADMPDGALPDVIAAAMTDEELTLVLATPNRRAPTPWRVDEDGTRWHLRVEDSLPWDESRRDSTLAPYPTLASVGCAADGRHWLLDLERITLASLSGDTDRSVDLARFVAAELAHNPWSEMIQVLLVGFGEELVAANPQRLAHRDDLAAATATIRRRLTSVTAALSELDTDVLDGRLRDIAADQWAPTVLLAAPHSIADREQLNDLLAALDESPNRRAVAVVLAADPNAAALPVGWQMSIDARSTLTIPDLGMEITACQLPADEAAPLAQLLAAAATVQDEPAPSAHGNAPWDRHTDACGALTRTPSAPCDDGTENAAVPGQRQPADTTVARPAVRLAAAPAPLGAPMLPLEPHTYLRRAATTATDIATLAPTVSTGRRGQVERADPALDVDLAAWHDPTCPRPKVRLLGTPCVSAGPAAGPAGGERAHTDHFHTEAIVWLATRGRGMLAAEFASVMWPREVDVAGKAKVRKAVQSVRAALGQDPVTGDDYLVSTFEGRVARYSIPAALIDAELFRRLRARGTARGADGVPDLWAALDLVDGPPFDGIDADGGRARGGWAWLVDANARLDFEYQAMIVDTAHTVAVRHLGDGEPEQAARAAHIALSSGAFDDVPLLDLIAAAQAQDDEAAAEAYARQLVANAGEEDLPPRTFEVLTRLRNRWRQHTEASDSHAAVGGH